MRSCPDTDIDPTIRRLQVGGGGVILKDNILQASRAKNKSFTQPISAEKK